jgi:hypothetical protein
MTLPLVVIDSWNVSAEAALLVRDDSGSSLVASSAVELG